MGFIDHLQTFFRCIIIIMLLLKLTAVLVQKLHYVLMYMLYNDT